MKPDENDEVLTLRSRPTSVVSFAIPEDTLASLHRVAQSRDMNIEALMKFYIGQGLRQDLARLFSERVLETAAQVLARHLGSPEEVAAILREIRSEAA